MTERAELFIGIDGGGSGCRARIRNAHGQMLAEATGGPANFYQDFEGALANVKSLIHVAAREADTVPRALHAGLGLAGLVTSVDPKDISAERLGVATAIADVDAYTACLGAFGGGEGAIVIAGTGSIGFGVKNGQRFMVGGWGMLLGDQGSGAWLGLEALRHTADVFDGFAAESLLSKTVKERLGATMFDVSVWSEKASPKDYAELAPTLFALAGQGDKAAQKIVSEGAVAITRLVRALQSHGMDRLALLGGLSQIYGNLVDQDIRQLLQPPQADARDGAILMAGGRIPR